MLWEDVLDLDDALESRSVAGCAWEPTAPNDWGDLTLLHDVLE